MCLWYYMKGVRISTLGQEFKFCLDTHDKEYFDRRIDAMLRTYVKTILCIFVVTAVFMLSISLWTGIVSSEPVVIFEMEDPVGDDYGPGTYIYPTHEAFVSGLFDLTFFRVSHDIEYAYFDLTFGEVTNTWNAPEGFSHQLINIYIDTTKNAGRIDTVRKGAMVEFDKKHGWDIFIKALGWGGCTVFTANDEDESQGISDGLDAEVLPDGKTIRVKVPLPIIGQPEDNWGYYVLIGSQDAFGEDDFRPVMEEAGPWTFGGGSNLEFNPNVIDLLAYEGGKFSQEKLLGSYDIGKGTLATLMPVSSRTISRGFSFFKLPFTPMIVLVVILLLIGFVVLLLIRRKRFS